MRSAGLPARVRFIHTADLHLGSPLKGLSLANPRLARMLRSALWEAFGRLIDEACSHEVDFVLIAGDVFDSPDPAYGDMMRFAEGMARLDAAGIPVFVATGNHERACAWTSHQVELAANVRIFAGCEPEYAAVTKDGRAVAALVGRGCEGILDEGVLSRMSARLVFRACGDGVPFAIGIMHSGLDIDRSVQGVSPALLRAAGLDYWALGHIHAPSCDDWGDPRIAYPGCIQGRDVNEPGDHGCLLVTLEEGQRNEARFLPLSKLAWERLAVDVTEAQSVAHAERMVVAALRQRRRELASPLLLARVSLEGQSALQGQLSRKDVLEDMRERINGAGEALACDSISCHLSAPYDRDALYDQGLFPAALLASIDALREDPAVLRERVESALAQRGLPFLGDRDERVRRWCDGAEDLLLGMLMGGRRG